MKIALSLLPLVLVAQTIAPKDPSSERVRFDWPVGTIANVDTDYVNETLIDGAVQQRTELRMTHDMRVLAEQSGRAIENSQHRHVQSSGDVPSALRALIPLWIPQAIINDKGEFVGVEQAERVQELLADMYAQLANSPAASSTPAYKEFLQQMTAADALADFGRSEWISTVGKWVGSTLDTKPIDGSGAISMGVSVPTVTHQSTSDRSPCKRADTSTDCVTFEIRHTVTREGLSGLLDYANRGATSAVPGTLTMIETVERAKLEIATMLPHEVSIIRTMRLTVDDNRKTASVEMTERRTMRYTYKGAR